MKLLSLITPILLSFAVDISQSIDRVAAFQQSLPSPLLKQKKRTHNSFAISLVDKSISSYDESKADAQRRKTIFGSAVAGLTSFLGGGGGVSAKAAAAASVDDNEKPLADYPMRRLKLPKGGLGREYVIIQVYIEGNGPYDFMLDSGLTTEMITPHLQQILSLTKSSGITKQGLSAGVVSQSQNLIQLNDVSLFAKGQEPFPLNGPLNAIVTDFPQEHLDPSHDPVEGMLGMEVLEQFDVDFDFPAGRLRLWKPHTVESVAKKNNLASIDALVVNETLLLGFRLVNALSTKDSSGDGVATQPFLGVVDCGASFSVVNWQAAKLLGLPSQNDGSWRKKPAVTGVGVDGQPQLLPTTDVQLSYVGGQKTKASFTAPPSDFMPWDKIQVAVGDLPVFSQLLGDGRTPYKGPAGIVGLDILTQRRLILETSSTRQRRIYVGKIG